jgi:CubicO group peptidase (beta-lactamase class C family)
VGRIIKSLDEPVRTNLGKATYDIILQNAVSRGVPEDVAAQLLDRVTIAQLLSHTAGTTASGFMGYSPQSDHIKTSAEVLRGGLGNANSPPVYVHGIPGLQREYSGGGSTVLQAMLENIAREKGFPSYALLMKENVLDPLGMTRSFYCDAAPLRQSEANYATAYQNGAYPLENRQDFHVYPEQGAAGLWTTSLDLVKGLLGVAHTALGTSSAVKLHGNTWIKPGIAQEIFKKRSDLAHQGDAYYCGFQVEFLDGEGQFARDGKLVRISHAGGNEGYQ